MKSIIDSVEAGLVTAAVCGFLPPVTAPPQLFSRVEMALAVLVACTVVFTGLLWAPRFRALDPERQRSAIWTAAASTGLVVFILPMLRFL